MYRYTKENLGNKVKSLMILNNDTQKDLAELLGINYSSLSNKFVGKRNFTLDDLLKIAELYNVDMNYFFKD